MAILVKNMNTPSVENESTPGNISPGAVTAQPADTDLQAKKRSPGVDQLHSRPRSAASGQPLTEQNLAEHNLQQAQLASVASYHTNIHRARIARLAEAGRGFGITPHDLRGEYAMQDSNAASPMEWFLAENNRNRRARTFPGLNVHDGCRNKDVKKEWYSCCYRLGRTR